MQEAAVAPWPLWRLGEAMASDMGSAAALAPTATHTHILILFSSLSPSFFLKMLTEELGDHLLCMSGGGTGDEAKGMDTPS